MCLVGAAILFEWLAGICRTPAQIKSPLPLNVRAEEPTNTINRNHWGERTQTLPPSPRTCTQAHNNMSARTLTYFLVAPTSSATSHEHQDQTHIHRGDKQYHQGLCVCVKKAITHETSLSDTSTCTPLPPMHTDTVLMCRTKRLRTG